MSGHPSEPSRQDVLRHMRVPIIAFVSLICLLGIIVALGALAPSHTASIIEFGLLVCMVLIVLLLSMEVPSEPPLMRFFASVGFAWVAILFAMTILDYTTR